MKTYTVADDLWVVTTFFNPLPYASRLANYRVFAAPFNVSNSNLVTAICTFADGRSAPPSEIGRHFRIPMASLLWQKERLINCVRKHLPKTCRKVAWVDADLLFENHEWQVEASELLECSPVVQLFQQAVMLPAGTQSVTAGLPRERGIVHSHLRGLAAIDHGHPGFGWAIRREILDDFGLYDACVAGGADHLMAHVFLGQLDSKCISSKLAGRHADHFHRWAADVDAAVRGSVDAVSGQVYHLWHGAIDDRRYRQRHEQIKQLGFDPDRDICPGSSGAWEWNSERRELFESWARDYFARRQEDG